MKDQNWKYLLIVAFNPPPITIPIQIENANIEKLKERMFGMFLCFVSQFVCLSSKHKNEKNLFKQGKAFLIQKRGSGKTENLKYWKTFGF